jgi:hypothetical protein
MMAAKNLDDDEYVANLLKEDAKKTAKQYSLLGMDAFLPKRCVAVANPNSLA